MLPHSESDRGDGHAKCGVFGFSVSRFFSLLQVFFIMVFFFWRRMLYEMEACKVLYYMVRRRSLYCPARRGA